MIKVRGSDLIRAVIARTYMKSSDLIRAAPPIPIPTVGAVYDGTISTAPTFGALFSQVVGMIKVRGSDLIRAVIARTYMKSSDLIRAAPPIPIPTVGAVYDGTISTAPTFGALFS